jgi:hypothetical protein
MCCTDNDAQARNSTVITLVYFNVVGDRLKTSNGSSTRSIAITISDRKLFIDSLWFTVFVIDRRALKKKCGPTIGVLSQHFDERLV